MNIKAIKKSVAINAAKEQVWEVLFNNKNNTAWLGVFSEGSHAETDWKEGSTAVFKDKDENGIVGKIVESRPYNYLAIEYGSMITKGVVDTRELAKGMMETYTLEEENGGTRLHISCDMGEEWFDQMSAAWDKALDIIKTLAEQ